MAFDGIAYLFGCGKSHLYIFKAREIIHEGEAIAPGTLAVFVNIVELFALFKAVTARQHFKARVPFGRGRDDV